MMRIGTMQALRAGIDAIERRHAGPGLRAVQTGWPHPAASLTCGMVHEWHVPQEQPGHGWSAPRLLMAHLARQALGEADIAHARWVMWIGRRIWPSPGALLITGDSRRHHKCDSTLIARSLLVDPASDEDRLWAIDLCLRSAGSAVVIADGSGVNAAHSRRLQLAAESGSALALLARPSCELRVHSAAATRWLVNSVASTSGRPRWRIQLVRCKGVQRCNGMDANASLVLEHPRATSYLAVPAPVAHRSIPAATRLAG